MFALELEFLAGRYVATRHDDRDRPEWPPHPARLVFALVATAGPERTAAEEAALRWLCEQPPPAIAFSDAWPRSTVTAFVPVNDRAAPGQAAVGSVPRGRQPRAFPCVVPESPTVTYVWADAEPDPGTRAWLSSLAERIVYLGHSSSLVRACAVDRAPPATLVPGRGIRLLRVPAAGLVEALDAALARYEATGVRGPLPADYSPYGLPQVHEDVQLIQSTFGEMVVLRRKAGPRLPLAAAERLALSLRAAVLSAVPDPVPAAISGHGPNGSPLQQPHAAFVALPDVGHRNASGSLLGVGTVLPRDLEGADRDMIGRALESISESGLRVSRTVEWSVEPARFDSERPLSRGLQPETWTKPSRRYGTATPIELDRYVSDCLGEEAERIVAASAEHIGLSRPTRVSLSPVSPLAGGGHIRDIRRVADRPRRPLIHAILHFDEPVEGPVLLGTGRYRGLGLCRPLDRP